MPQPSSGGRERSLRWHLQGTELGGIRVFSKNLKKIAKGNSLQMYVVPGSVPPSVLSPEEIVIKILIILIIKHLLCPIKIRFLVFEPECVVLGHL